MSLKVQGLFAHTQMLGGSVYEGELMFFRMLRIKSANNAMPIGGVAL